MGDLSAEAKTALSQELVLVCDGTEAGTLYSHAEFLGAFQDALLERLEMSIPRGASVRTAFRALAAMRTEEAHKATLAAALVRLKKGGHAVPFEALQAPERRLVATFAANA